MLIDLDNIEQPNSIDASNFSSIRLKAYHCTRAIEKDILSSGLVCFDLDNRLRYLKEKLLDYGLPQELVDSYETAVRRDISGSNLTFRKGQVWFCLNEELLNDGCEKFFRYFGGEATYRIANYYTEYIDVKEALKNIGQPLVVTASIEISTSPESQVDRVRRKIRGELADSCEIYVQEDVLPENIIKTEIRNEHKK